MHYKFTMLYKGHSRYCDLRQMFITLVWNDQQLYHFHIAILPVLFCVYKISILIELQYNHVLTL